jgi:hypothetical protein
MKIMADEQLSNNVSWTASEFIDHRRGVIWYSWLALATVALTVLVYWLTKDYFAAAVIAVLGLIVAAVSQWKPRQLQYRLTDKGLHIEQKFYPYSQFKFFSIIHENDLSSLVLSQTKRYLPPLSVFIDADDEPAITELVGEHLPLQPGNADRIEQLSRRLRF